jgi:transcriptional regulator with XRE-family HTH domain
VAGFPLSSELRDALQAAYTRKKTAEGLTEQKIADLVGCSKTTVHHVVTKSHRPAKGSKDLPRICQVLEVDLGAYLPLDEEQRQVLRALARTRAAGRGEDFIEAVELAVRHLTTPERRGSS